jgi:hypothetical protein
MERLLDLDEVHGGLAHWNGKMTIADARMPPACLARSLRPVN